VDPDATPAPGPVLGERPRAQSLRCPYHSWTYDLAGRLLRAPHTEDVAGFEPADFALHPIAADTWGGFLFLHLTPDQAPPCATPWAAYRSAWCATRSSGWRWDGD